MNVHQFYGGVSLRLAVFGLPFVINRPELVIAAFGHHLIVDLFIDESQTLKRSDAVDVGRIDRTQRIDRSLGIFGGKAIFRIFNRIMDRLRILPEGPMKIISRNIGRFILLTQVTAAKKIEAVRVWESQ